MTTLKPDRRIKHHTADSLSRLLRRKGIAHTVGHTASGHCTLTVPTLTPAVAQFLGHYGFIHSVKHAHYFRQFEGAK